jgi:hypothetical protein
MTSTDDNIQGKGDRSRSRAREARGKANSKGKANSIKGKANSIQGKADYTANIIQGKSGYLHGSVGGLNVVIDPVGEFAVAASQATASQLSSIIPVVQLGKFAAQSSSDILINLAQLAAGALEDSQCPTDDEIDSTVSRVAVASEATQAPDWGDMDSQAL